MLARCHSACVLGIDGEPTEVEVHLVTASPRFDVVGLPDAAGREARDRVRSAVSNSGYRFPREKLVVNLAPAATPKTGAGHDLPMALGILAACGVVAQASLEQTLVFGELALDGRLRPVSGGFQLASTAGGRGLTRILAPPDNAAEAALASGCAVYAPVSLAEAVSFLNGRIDLEPTAPAAVARRPPGGRDFAEVKGQGAVKRTLIVAAAGGHNALLVGPPGAGKTLLAQRFPDLLPSLSRDEALEVARIRSGAGHRVRGLPAVRPLRSPSCGASAAGVLGGGSPPRPGEVSLAHRGVLFLDELPHFRGDVLEGLRQPLEDGHITISRARAALTFPARFQLLAAMNPCPCGFAGTPRCPCTPPAIERYRRRLSGPLLDRIDIREHVPPVQYEDLRTGEVDLTTADMHAGVLRARAAQRRRFGGAVLLNADMGPDALRVHCRLEPATHGRLERAVAKGDLSARGVARVLRVARTIADVKGDAHVADSHVLNALRLRVKHDVHG